MRIQASVLARRHMSLRQAGYRIQRGLIRSSEQDQYYVYAKAEGVSMFLCICLL